MGAVGRPARAGCVRCAHQRPDGSGAAVQGGRRLPVAARRLTVPPAASSNPTRLRRAGLLSHGQRVRVRIVAAFPSLCAEGLDEGLDVSASGERVRG